MGESHVAAVDVVYPMYINLSFIGVTQFAFERFVD